MKDSDLWMEFVDDTSRPGGLPSTLCGLCGQSGIVDTMGKVYSPAGYHCGVIAFCICPNGRAAKKAAEQNGQTLLEWAAWARAQAHRR